MFSLSEMLFIAILALVLIGPKQLPEVARTLGRFLNDLRRASGGVFDDIKSSAQFDLKEEIMKPLSKNEPTVSSKPQENAKKETEQNEPQT